MDINAVVPLSDLHTQIFKPDHLWLFDPIMLVFAATFGPEATVQGCNTQGQQTY